MNRLGRVGRIRTGRRGFLAFAGIAGGLVVLGRGSRSVTREIGGRNKALINCSAHRDLTDATIEDYRTRAAGSSG